MYIYIYINKYIITGSTSTAAAPSPVRSSAGVYHLYPHIKYITLSLSLSLSLSLYIYIYIHIYIYIYIYILPGRFPPPRPRRRSNHPSAPPRAFPSSCWVGFSLEGSRRGPTQRICTSAPSLCKKGEHGLVVRDAAETSVHMPLDWPPGPGPPSGASLGGPILGRMPYPLFIVVVSPCRCEPLRGGCCGGEGVLGVS